jgi:hypothetical protein
MDRLRLFSTQAGYEDEEANLRYPTVSYIEGTKEVMFIPEEVKYKQKYLTTEALESGTISFNIWRSMGTDMITSISYSTDNGQTWTTTNNTDNKSEHLVIDVNVNQGDKVLWKGIATQTGYNDSDDYGDYVGSFFSSDCEFNAYGNVMSLLYGDNFYNNKNLGNTDGTFAYLFRDYDREKTCEVVSAQNLMLPATTLAECCYSSMFSGCTSLTTAPVLPATTLAQSCYSYMFQGCTALTTATELPATTLADWCYYYMFSGCTSLTTAPVLPATTLANSCYNYMFNGCTSLTTAPTLPATTIATNCYSDMFYGCTSLTTAPATLPATTLAKQCYNSMFGGCKSLTTAPELPATTLVASCYNGMFYSCSNLNYIKAMFTTTPSASYTINWVSGVAATGTFVKNSAASWNVTGNNGIPSGWTVQTASE